MKLEDAKAALNTKTEKITKKANKLRDTMKTPGIGWEIGAYGVRATAIAVPSIVIMTMENSWVKSGLGTLATMMIIALLIIFKEPIEKAAGYAPGVIPFAIFTVLAILFQTLSDVFLTIGISGLGGCTAAIPLHLKYLSYKKQEKSPELVALETIATKLK